MALTHEPSFLAPRRGKLTLTLLCAIAFLDCVDAPIVNVALHAIRGDLHFSVQGLQWVGRAPTCSPTADSCCSGGAPPT